MINKNGIVFYCEECKEWFSLDESHHISDGDEGYEAFNCNHCGTEVEECNMEDDTRDS